MTDSVATCDICGKVLVSNSGIPVFDRVYTLSERYESSTVMGVDKHHFCSMEHLQAFAPEEGEEEDSE